MKSEPRTYQQLIDDGGALISRGLLPTCCAECVELVDEQDGGGVVSHLLKRLTDPAGSDTWGQRFQTSACEPVASMSSSSSQMVWGTSCPWNSTLLSESVMHAHMGRLVERAQAYERLVKRATAYETTQG